MASRGEPRVGLLARAFFCVGVSVDASGAPAPKLLLRRTFAADGKSNSSDDQLVSVAYEKHFCFPEYVPGALTSLVPETHARPSTYTFALTESDGSQTYGFCRRFLPPGDGARYPIVTCILSKLPWFAFFWEALEPLDAHVWPLARPALFDTGGARPESTNPALPQNAHVTRYLTELCEREAPPPRAEVSASTPWHPPGTALPQRVSLYAPDDGATSSRVAATAARGVRFAPLLRGAFTDAQCCLALFAALLFERRVIISGVDAGAVSRAAHAAAALIAPFEWQHIFLPLLPHPFLEVCTAPMPFLVGVHSAHAAALDRLPKEEVFRVDLDTGEYTYFPADLDALPSKPRRALEQKLEFQIRGQNRIDDAAVARAFRVFLSTTVSAYRRHVVPETSERRIPENALVADGVWLDQNAFEAHAATRRTKMMLGNLRGTRLYEVFVRGRLEAIARDPKQTGLMGARLGNSTAGESVTGSLISGGGSSSGGDAMSGLNSAVSAEAALLAYAAEDFQHELPQDAALTAVYRAGSASAAAGAASAAAATTRAAAHAAKSAAWGAKTSAKMFDAFVGSARAYGTKTYGNTSLAGSTVGMHGKSAHRGNYGAFEGGHDDDSPVGGPARSAGAFVGVDRFRRDDERRQSLTEDASASKPPPAPSTATTAAAAAAAALARRHKSSPDGLSIDVNARAYHSGTPSPTAPAPSPASNFSPTAFSPTPSNFSPAGSASGFDSGTGTGTGIPRRQSSSGSMAAAVAAATARRALSPTGTAGTNSPQFSPTANSAFSGNGYAENAPVDPFAAAVLSNAPPVLQAAPTSRRTPSRTDWVDFDAGTPGTPGSNPASPADPNPGTSPASPSAASAASPSSVASPGGSSPHALADPFATLSVTAAVRLAERKRASPPVPVPVPAQTPADPGDALAAALGLDSPAAQPSLIDF